MQWRDRLTTAELAGSFGMVECIGDLLTQWKLRWLGHVARMSDIRHPKRLLFGWFPQKSVLPTVLSSVGGIRSVRT